MLERIVKEIGYEMAGRMKIFDCIPILTMQNNGLREIRSDHDTRFMVTFVDIVISPSKPSSNTVPLSQDDDSVPVQLDDPVPIQVISPNVEVDEPVPIQVIFPNVQVDDLVDVEIDMHVDDPVAVGTRRHSKRKRSSSNADFIPELEEEDGDALSETDGSDSEFDCVDSGNDVSDGDDDLDADNVDEDSDDNDSDKRKRKRASVKGKTKCEIKEEESEDEDLWGPESDDETVKCKFKNFREDDLHDPKFSTGQVFCNVDLLRRAIRSYSCKHRKPIKLPINDKKRVRAVCLKDCSWYLWASSDSRTEEFQIKRYRGQLLCAIGMDPNDCIFPIAMAAVEVEDTAAWTWFLETLKNDLGIVNTTPWTIMLDKHKGLINVVRVVFSDSEHRFCVRHMWQNFQQLFKEDVLKNQLWTIARSNTVTLFKKHMDQMKVINSDAHAWLAWVRAFQSDLPKCDILLNNNCEVFNKYILEARELPVLSMLETIKAQIMTRHYTKNKDRSSWTGPICPKIRKKLDKHIELSRNVFANAAGDGLFQWLKSGLPPPNAQDLNVPPPQTEPTVTQEQNPVLNNPNAQNPIAEDLLVDTLIHEKLVQRQLDTRPIPFSTFITDAQSQLSQTSATEASSTTLRQEMKKAEEKARKKLEQEKIKAQHAEAKAMEDVEKKEKRRQEAELKKKARVETKRIISEVRK
uniref:Uncharacterized protein n=1 Tax=Avena sativa TaxID=4498 RepID=A0ACD5V6R4_AVESA